MENIDIRKEASKHNVFEASPSRRLGDKAWSRAWASGSPRPQRVWRPPHRIRRRLGANGVRRTPTTAPRTPDAGRRGRAPKRARPRGESTARPRETSDAREIDRACASSGGKSTARVIDRECGRGERKKEGGGRTSTSAGLLLCSCPPAGHPCRGAGLHLRLAVRPCRGAAPASSHIAAAGEGRGREKAADGPRPPLGSYSARLHRPAGPTVEPACICSWPSALPPRALLCICRPLCLLVLCSAVRSASPLGPGSLNIVYSLLCLLVVYSLLCYAMLCLL